MTASIREAMEDYEALKRARDTLYGFIIGELTGFPGEKNELLRYLDLLYERAVTAK